MTKVTTRFSWEPTPYLVHCIEGCGEPSFLTEEEYTRQLSRANKTWQCPRCLSYGANWDDEHFEAAMEKTRPAFGKQVKLLDRITDIRDWIDEIEGFVINEEYDDAAVLVRGTLRDEISSLIERLEEKETD